MAKLFVLYCDIYNNENVAKEGSKFSTVLNKSYKIAKVTKFCQIWSHWLWRRVYYYMVFKLNCGHSAMLLSLEKLIITTLVTVGTMTKLVSFGRKSIKFMRRNTLAFRITVLFEVTFLQMFISLSTSWFPKSCNKCIIQVC